MQNNATSNKHSILEKTSYKEMNAKSIIGRKEHAKKSKNEEATLNKERRLNEENNAT